MRVARIDELMDELNKLVYDSMISAMQKAAPEEWETAPTMMVDLKVPEVCRAAFTKFAEMDEITNKSVGQIESGFFSTLVIKGIFYELDNNPTFSEGPLYVEDMLVRLDTLMDELRPLLKEAMKK
jgi:hypothetical protein